MTPAEIAQRNLVKPDGSSEPAWVVTAHEERGTSTVVFSGIEAADRASTYARERYKPITFRMLLEPGLIGVHGRQIGAANGGVQ